MLPITLFVDVNYWSPYAMSAFVALKAKGVPFEIKTVDLEQDQHLAPEYAQRALTARVPMLVHDDFALTESSSICEYVDETFAAPEYTALYPSHPRDRARARQVQAWIRSDLMPIRMERSTAVLFGTEAYQPLSEQAQAAAQKLYSAVDLMLNGKSQLFDRWSIADADLALMLNRLAKTNETMPATVRAYASSQWQHPAIVEWIALGKAV